MQWIWCSLGLGCSFFVDFVKYALHMKFPYLTRSCPENSAPKTSNVNFTDNCYIIENWNLLWGNNCFMVFFIKYSCRFILDFLIHSPQKSHKI